MKIALFGGRFDPPHAGHINIAKEIIKQELADEVWFIPANTHPWRKMEASAQDRLAMTKLLEKGKIKTSDIEVKRGGETYTIDTVRECQISNVKYQMLNEKRIRNSRISYSWVIGSDQLKDFHRWKDYQKLQKLIRFLVIPRKGYTYGTLPENFFLINNYVANDISSSIIRDRIKRGLSISDLVPEKVEEYIREKNLYK